MALPTHHPADRGFTLVEALVAMLIVSMVVISYIGIRTSALLDATYARNWRLAREIAEEKMSELMAGARENMPESGIAVPIDKYEGFSFKIALGETDVAALEEQVASDAAGDDGDANQRIEWQREREDYRRASSRGLSRADYEQERNTNNINQKLAEKAPSATEFEEVAVAVYFPKLEARFPDDRDALVIKARISTLAISGLTPEQAKAIADSKGQSQGDSALPGGASDGGGSGGGLPGGR
ncbi:MAG: prepilin-type N-terminal cleavage/methylation domain-containing protein [Planctomycetes bacterium]|jgi:prepilin-type N-terminal cleavage/methylation domain-containing protein|nr:prepilin-type N-terminal cleavage/methylation domain-containing protein [Planctomycetota bacterium]